MIWSKSGRIKCWNCFRWISEYKLSENDCLCPYCYSEIDIKDLPYSEPLKGEEEICYCYINPNVRC